MDRLGSHSLTQFDRKARPPVRTYGDAGACGPPCTCIARSGVAAGWVHGRVARARPRRGIVHVPVLVRKGLHAAQSSGLRSRRGRHRHRHRRRTRGPPLQVQFLPMHVRPCHVQFCFLLWHPRFLAVAGIQGRRMHSCSTQQCSQTCYYIQVTKGASTAQRKPCMTRKKWKQTRP
jgi:hypothetical protein